jgi:hypothetical protein
MKLTTWLTSNRLSPLGIVITLWSQQILFTTQSYAAGIIETGPFAGFGSIAAYTLWVELGGGSAGPGVCSRIALLVDPPARGVTDLSIALQYDAAQLTFDQQNSGFLTPFAVNSDNPPVVAREGTVPIDLLPSSGFNPGQPLPGSSATLTDTGTEVSLDYHLSSPVTINGETNFFLFSFDFKDPPVIDIGTSSITYLAADPGVDFTQVSFVCHTDVVPDPGCGSENPVEGITLNLERIPEPGTWGLLATAIAGLFLVDLRCRTNRQSNVSSAGCGAGRRIPRLPRRHQGRLRRNEPLRPFDFFSLTRACAYFRMGHNPGGFRVWWRALTGSDKTLENSPATAPRRFHVVACRGGDNPSSGS